MNKTVYIITGPTAVGKSEIALKLATKLDGEIINCDSIQLYKYLDIGSAKPSEEEMIIVPHHLYGMVDPDYNMTVATYQKLAIACINNILERGKTPILVGGTGLYINSVLYNMDFAAKPDTYERREELEKMAEERGAEYMHAYLAAIDEECASRIHPNNTRKIVRAIEAFEAGEGIKPLDNCELNEDYDFKFYALTMDREWLYAKINNRVLKLVKAGLVDEVKSLLDMGYTSDTQALKGIGYKEIIDYLEGKTDQKTAIFEIMKNTRHFAKRQLTWFRRYDNLKWIEIQNGQTTDEIAEYIYEDSIKGDK